MKNLIRITPFTIGCLLIAVSCGVFYSFGTDKPLLVSAIDNRIMDIMYRIRGVQSTSDRVVIIAIDEKSIQKLGQWPWPRNVLSELAKKIHNSGATVLGFDIVFAEADRSSPLRLINSLPSSVKTILSEQVVSDALGTTVLDHDELLGAALAGWPTVLGYSFVVKEDGLKSEISQPFPSWQVRVEPGGVRFSDLALIPAYRAVTNILPVAQAQSEGFFNVFSDEAGTVRRVPLLMTMDDIPYPSLALETYRVAMGYDAVTIHVSTRINTSKKIILGISAGNRSVKTDSNGRMLVNFRGPEKTFPFISAIDVLEQSMGYALKDKLVLIGSTASGLHDIKATPFSGAVPGVEINATVIDNILKGDPFVYDVLTEIGITYTLIIVGGLILCAILAFSGPLVGSMGAFIFFSSVIIGNYYFFFLQNKQVGITYSLATCFLILVVVSIYNYFTEGKAKRYIQNAFSHYVAPEVVKRLLKEPEALSLKGEQKEMTVMFCDIRGFTSISEKMDSKDLSLFMNYYLSRMSRIIMENKGTLDKFIGDAIMAFWGAPEHDPDHAVNAVKTALQMKTELSDINKNLKQWHMPEIAVGIGINTGLMNVGNFGSDKRFDYTVMGDHVNMASRLEGACKDYATSILISEFTETHVRKHITCRYIDHVQLRGRNAPVGIYEPG